MRFPLIVRRVMGKSMQPTLRQDSIILATRYIKELQPNEVVIIWHDGLEKIKRIQKIKDDKVFVVGDNLSKSVDSRSFGWLPKACVIGRVFWPRLLP